MSKHKLGRRRQLARPSHYKQAGAVEEALRQRGVSAHVQPGWRGQSLLVHVADPDAPAAYLDDYADTLAEALYADGVQISCAGRTFIVAPGWLVANDAAEDQEASVWPPADEAEDIPDTPPDPRGTPASRWADHVTVLHLVEVLDGLQSALTGVELRADDSVLLHLTGNCNPAAVRGQLEGLRPALAVALGAASCSIGGCGRQLTITPAPRPAVGAPQGAERR